MRRISILILLVFVFFSCKKNNNRGQKTISHVDSLSKKSEILADKLKAEDIYNRIFYLVTKTDSVDVLYHYCNASINTIKVFKDSIWENFGQEDYTMLIEKVELNGKKINFKGEKSQDTPEKLYAFSLIDKSKGYWSINNKIYVDSKKIDTIQEFWQPYKDCWEDEAIYMAELIIKKESTNPIPYINIGDFHWENKDYAKAKKFYLQYLKYMKLLGKEKKVDKKIFSRID